MTPIQYVAWQATRDQQSWGAVKAATEAVERYMYGVVADRLAGHGAGSDIVDVVRGWGGLAHFGPTITELRAERLARGISQADMATQLGVDRSTLGRWEINGMPDDQRHRYAELLLPQRAWLRGGDTGEGRADAE